MKQDTFGKSLIWCGLAAIAISLLLTCSGCTSVSVQLEHISHPFAGPPFGPTTEEDSLNQPQVCAAREEQRWYVEHCVGYKLGDGGFYGPRLTYTARVGRRWGLREH